MTDAAIQMAEKKVWAHRSPAFAGAGCTHGDPAPVFEASEHVFDFMALLVEGFIVRDLHLAVFLWRDAGRNVFIKADLNQSAS